MNRYTDPISVILADLRRTALERRAEIEAAKLRHPSTRKGQS